MALLMVHLLAARNWAQMHERYLNDPDFYLGAISPDAIHIRDKGDKSNKNRIHLNNWLSPDPDEVVRYWKKHHTPFDIGYGIHVLTDAQWVPRYRHRIPQLVLPGGKTDMEAYYRDSVSTDYRLYHKMGTPLFDLVERGSAPKDHPLLSEHEIAEWQRVKAREYRKCDKPDYYAKYLTTSYVLEFLIDSMLLMEKTYRRHKHE